MNPRIGQGYDIHRTLPGDGIFLGGVKVDCDYSFAAHSDGDVLLHALTDAILGAMGKPDIGECFPDTSEENKGRDSCEFVRQAVLWMKENDLSIGNIDSTILLQRPKLSLLKQTIVDKIAELCDCSSSLVSVKAKTAEGLGAIGKGDAVGASATVLLVPAGRDK